MKLVYSENLDYKFPHWVDFEEHQFTQDFNRILNINDWCGQNFGELGITWGYNRQVKDNTPASALNHPNGPNPARILRHNRTIHYSWRFENKEDAMMFKLTWGGV